VILKPHQFFFETSPNTKPKEKKVGDMVYYIPTVWKSGGTRSPCPLPNCANAHSGHTLRAKRLASHCFPVYRIV